MYIFEMSFSHLMNKYLLQNFFAKTDQTYFYVNFFFSCCSSRFKNVIPNITTSSRYRNQSSQCNQHAPLSWIGMCIFNFMLANLSCGEWPVGKWSVGFAGLGNFFLGEVKFLKGKCHQRNVKRSLKHLKIQEWIRYRRIMNYFCKHLKVSRTLIPLVITTFWAFFQCT